MDLVDIQIREVLRLNGGKIPRPGSAAFEEIRRLNRKAGRSSYIDIREPAIPGNNNRSESAANGGNIDLRENGTMGTNNQPHLRTLKETSDRMKKAFVDLGFSEASAESAARGRDNAPLDDDGYAERQLQFSRENGFAEYATFPAEDLRTPAERRAEQAEIETSMAESFQRMGYSERQAKIMARGRL